MNPARFLLPLLLLQAGLLAGPVLLRSEPEDGAIAVPCDVGALRFRFDGDMDTADWSLAVSPKGEFPPTEGDESGAWRDPRCFEMRLGVLKPGTVYAVQLNSDRRMSFRSARGEPLPVTVVSFRTAEPPRLGHPLAPQSWPRSAAGTILFSRTERVEGAEGLYPRIWGMTAEGEQARAVIQPQEPCVVFQPALSCDGRQLLFTSNWQMSRSACYLDIFAAEIASGNVRRLTGREECEPSTGTGSILGVVKTGIMQGYTAEGQPVEANPYDLLDARTQVRIAVQGGGGRVFRITEEAQFPGAQGGAKLPAFLLPEIPAGTRWVKAWVNKHVGGVAFRVVVQPGVQAFAELDLGAGNILASRPGLTPDGRFLVFLYGVASYDKRVKIPFQGLDTIAVYDLSHPDQPVVDWMPGKTQGLTTKDPSLSRDGRWIAFSLGPLPQESLAIIQVADLRAGNQGATRVVARGEAPLGATVGYSQPAWSRDGARLAFVRTDRRILMEAPELYSANLWICNADGSGMRQVTRVAPNECPALPCWSPDGKRLAYALLTSTRPRFGMLDTLGGPHVTCDIWTISVDGTGARRLTSDGRSTEPSWLP